jgi:hypothetical protein
MALDTFDGHDTRCAICKTDCRVNEALDKMHTKTADYEAMRTETNYHKWEQIRHNIKVTFVSRWEVSCSPSCTFQINRGLDCKLTAEILAWMHLRRWDNNAAKEFANNRGIRDLVYCG